MRQKKIPDFHAGDVLELKLVSITDTPRSQNPCTALLSSRVSLSTCIRLCRRTRAGQRPSEASALPEETGGSGPASRCATTWAPRGRWSAPFLCTSFQHLFMMSLFPLFSAI